jgi:hypothetical protein
VFKNKLFLYGLGTGLITASILLQIVSFSDPDKQLNDSTASLSEEVWDGLFTEQLDILVTAANRNGYKLSSLDEVTYTEEELKDKIETALNETVKDDNQVSASEDIIQMSSFIILKGMGSEEVADQLLQLKLIKDKAGFMQVMEREQLNTIIQAGLYVFEGTPELEQIITKITKK